MSESLRKPQHLKELIQQILKKLESKSSCPTAKIFCRWPDIIGKKIAKHTQPLSFRSGQLIVSVDSPVWINQLKFLEDKILKRIKRETDIEVKKIIFRIK